MTNSSHYLCIFVLIYFISVVILSQHPQPDPDYTKQPQWQGECNKGKSQSPILISTNQIKLCPYDKSFQFNYTNARISIHPFGKNLKNIYNKQSFIRYIEREIQTDFYSAQFHWHSPSEHWVDGEKFDLELHIVHTSKTAIYEYAVVSLLFKIDPIDRPDKFDQVNFINDSGNMTFKFPFNLEDKFVYHYKGSLTTPLCDETADWFVYMEILPIRKTNLEKIKEVINDGKPNARYLQKLLGGLCKKHKNLLFQLEV